jgi:hypothetical protein
VIQIVNTLTRLETPAVPSFQPYIPKICRTLLTEANLNIHFHMLVLDSAYLVDSEPPVFRQIEPPRQEELQALVERIGERIGRALERQGVLVRDAEEGFPRSRPRRRPATG